MHHRYGTVAIDLARRLLTLSEGDRMDPIGKLATEFGTGRGTIQSAFKLLADDGALQLESLGKRGSFIKKLDRSILLEKAELTAIIGAMPVAYSTHFQGLATGLNQTFLESDIPLILAMLRGSKNRIHFLKSGRCDFIITSRLTWEGIQQDKALRLLFTFGPGSNIENQVLIMAENNDEKEITDGMRVGIDSSSNDHMRLTLQECEGKSVQLVEMSYGQSLQKLLAGEIDATVWDAGAGFHRPPPSLKVLPLTRRNVESDANTEAVLIVRSDSGALQDLISQLIDPQEVIAMQRKVIAHEVPPIF
ncbi:GntR family transcriptional regulator YhfZ [Lentibacillus salicampi]|uniref:GntR family transcriptional regulator n=1 Tax=Lentibacillus salicampi TaxID=175306 RepID=A0A4Y9AEE4_9BACI|nr:GntR family transcriptional regulator YhfZ [Lentibacillus salicampi]TFJ94259.1 GntR family transcriptional regulator [Lentibacillus salicampi]